MVTSWFIVVGLGVAVWWYFRGGLDSKRKKRPTPPSAPDGDKDDRGALTLAQPNPHWRGKHPNEGLPAELIEVLAKIDAIDQAPNSVEREPERDELKEVERALRNEHRLKWSGDTSQKPPIKQLTDAQGRCLFWAARRYVIRPDWLPYDGPNTRNNSYQSKRTVESLIKHGFLSAHPLGHYEITDLGLQAFETLPRRDR